MIREIKSLLRALIIVGVVVLGPVIIHAGEGKALLANRKKAHKCNTCGKEFAQKYRLTRHIMIHTGNRPFGCDTCARRFTDKRNLTRHMKIHTGKRSFGCGVCGRRFAQKSNLERHMRVHTGERPFGCNKCARRFTNKGNLTQHMRTHMGERPFECDTCGQGFTHSRSLKRHKERKVPCKASEKPLSVSSAKIVSSQVENVVASGDSDSDNQNQLPLGLLLPVMSVTPGAEDALGSIDSHQSSQVEDFLVRPLELDFSDDIDSTESLFRDTNSVQSPSTDQTELLDSFIERYF